MKIAWISYDFGEYSVRHVSAMVAEHDVLLVIPQAELDQHRDLLDPRVKILAFDKPRLRQPLRQAISVWKLYRQVVRFRPDVIHFQQGHLWFNAILPLLKRIAPLVLTIHDPQHHAGDTVSAKTPQWVIDFGFRQADQAIVHGRQLVSEVAKRHRLPTDRIHVIPHIAMGNRNGKFRPASKNGADQIAPTQNVPRAIGEPTNQVLFFGRIWEYKGLEYLIRAEPILAKRVPDYRIVIAGEGEDFAKYQAMINGNDRFMVHNTWIDDERRADFFRQATVVVLPYTEATQSGVVPVAYAFGKPVVATRVGALPECIDDGVTGLLVPPRDVEALAAAIGDLLTDTDRAHAMGEAGYRKLMSESSAEVVAAQTIAVYEAACQARPK